MATHAAEARAALRRLLRALDAHVTSVAGNAQWRERALAAFRAPPPADPAAAAEGLQAARDYADLVEGVAHHRGLLASYSLGLDPDERNRRMVAATARRVGFALPHEERPPRRPKGGQAQQQQQQEEAEEEERKK